MATASSSMLTPSEGGYSGASRVAQATEDGLVNLTEGSSKSGLVGTVSSVFSNDSESTLLGFGRGKGGGRGWSAVKPVRRPGPPSLPPRQPHSPSPYHRNAGAASPGVPLRRPISTTPDHTLDEAVGAVAGATASNKRDIAVSPIPTVPPMLSGLSGLGPASTVSSATSGLGRGSVPEWVRRRRESIVNMRARSPVQRSESPALEAKLQEALKHLNM